MCKLLTRIQMNTLLAFPGRPWCKDSTLYIKKRTKCFQNVSHRFLLIKTSRNQLAKIFRRCFLACFAHSWSVISCCCEKGIWAPRCDENLFVVSVKLVKTAIYVYTRKCACVCSHGFTWNWKVHFFSSVYVNNLYLFEHACESWKKRDTVPIRLHFCLPLELWCGCLRIPFFVPC